MVSTRGAGLADDRQDDEREGGQPDQEEGALLFAWDVQPDIRSGPTASSTKAAEKARKRRSPVRFQNRAKKRAAKA
jgi:hypothetical protein